MSEQSCYHCGQDVPEAFKDVKAQVEDKQYPVCCLGCKAVTEHIYSNGLGNYYEFRSDLATRPDDGLANQEFKVFDDGEFLDLVSQSSADNSRKITLSVENIHCAACSWLIEHSLVSIGGIVKVNVNTINQRADITWLPEQINLSDILTRMAAIGYPSSPFKVTDTEQNLKRQDKQFIKRLGVAGLFTMQVMMLAFAMYFGAFEYMESHQLGYFKWLSMLLSVPVVFYSALPFLFGCISSLKAKQLSMDVPVAVAIYGAFFASLYQLVLNGLDGAQGEVFFESIAMFTFLLLIGKYLEFRAKSKAVLSNANLNKTIPTVAAKVLANGEVKQVLVKDLNAADTVLVKAGEHIAFDGVIIEGSTSVNESVLNGEFAPVSKSLGDKVLAGSVNSDGVIKIQITAIGEDTTLSHIGQLQSEFAAHKPQYTEFADRIAHWFVLSQLVLAFITFVIWMFVQPSDALWVSLSVLVATCPCALSLATPTAYTCIMSALNKKGILIKEPSSFDKLNQITHMGFDKTGTLTKGAFAIQASHYVDCLDQDWLNSVVKTVQSHSEHPIAKAFMSLSSHTDIEGLVDNVKVEVGKGLVATTELGEVKIGSAHYLPTDTSPALPNANVFVLIDEKLAAEFYVADLVKAESSEVISNLKQSDIECFMLTGDSSSQVAEVAHSLALSNYQKACSPQQKASYIQALQKTDACVVMVGDGINDAPVFAASDISIAMGTGADISKQAADIIILNGNLSAIDDLLQASKETRKTIRNNLNWSIIYNLVILPVAMLGYVAPWVAVLGMSASSILVVTNSLKLLKIK